MKKNRQYKDQKKKNRQYNDQKKKNRQYNDQKKENIGYRVDAMVMITRTLSYYLKTIIRQKK